MTVEKKLVAFHISRLKDPNPEVRLRSIAELQALGDPDALDALRAVFDRDPSADVRRAAQAAGRAIYLNSRDGGPA